MRTFMDAAPEDATDESRMEPPRLRSRPRHCFDPDRPADPHCQPAYGVDPVRAEPHHEQTLPDARENNDSAWEERIVSPRPPGTPAVSSSGAHRIEIPDLARDEPGLQYLVPAGRSRSSTGTDSAPARTGCDRSPPLVPRTPSPSPAHPASSCPTPACASSMTPPHHSSQLVIEIEVRLVLAQPSLVGVRGVRDMTRWPATSGCALSVTSTMPIADSEAFRQISWPRNRASGPA